jgi:4-amino-4-deoxy-L-arabinose transferase-like glycosyltransferase
MQGPTLGENSNYALVRSLADGTPRIDRTRFEVGDLTAGDYRTYKGHIYSDKAPGFAFVTVPAFVVLRSLGLRTSGDPTRALWALRLWSVVVPGLLALLIVRGLAERISPGYGTATAVVVGAGTLVLPLATTFYSHVLTGLLLVAAFALLWRGRAQPERLVLPAAAGFRGGVAFATEYPAASAAAIFGVYAILDRPRVRRAAAYCGGLALGVAPLFAYNQWAFGSPTHLSYFGTYFGSELSSGSFTSSLHPSLINVLFTFFAMPGLFVLAPVLVLAIVGLGLLFAKGKRAEAAVIAAVAVAFSLYNASLPGIEYDAFTAGPVSYHI